MKSDEQIEASLWRGRVPVRLELSHADTTAHRSPAPSPLYLLLPRISYLPVAAGDAAAAHFASHAPPQPDGGAAEMWFSFNGEPLRWNIPVGVLFDLLFAGSGDDGGGGGGRSFGGGVGTSAAAAAVNDKDDDGDDDDDGGGGKDEAPPPLPWRLTVHFRSFPSKAILHCRTVYVAT
jgi:autophagy-related protein 5